MKNIGTKPIETKRLLLRQFTTDDAPAMYERWASDLDVTKYLTWQPHPNVEHTRALLAEWTENYTKGDYYNWAIELKKVGVIGSIGVVATREETKSAEVGYCIAKKYWGQGIMAEALKAVLDYLFEKAGFLRVSAKHDAQNPNSGKVMAKAGMKYESTLRQAGFNNRGIIDEVCYAMIKKDR